MKGGRVLGTRLRDLVVVLALISHLAAAFGVPLPVTAPRNAKKAGHPFPCQDRPCGCLTAEECWKGDCCCFTLEQKVEWAEANGVEPPPHVRPLVEARRARRSSRTARSCCSHNGEPPRRMATVACCDGADHPKAASCREMPTRGCQACAADFPQEARKNACSAHDRPSVRLVVGIFSQKCRGEGPAGLFKLDPAVVTVPTLAALLTLAAGFGADRPTTLLSTSLSPPTPPPRRPATRS